MAFQKFSVAVQKPSVVDKIALKNVSEKEVVVALEEEEEEEETLVEAETEQETSDAPRTS